MKGYAGVLIAAQAAGPSLSNSAVATSILPSQAKYTMLANFLNDIGQELHLSGMVDVSNIVTTPGTLIIDVRFGGTVVYSSQAMQLSTTAHTTLPLRFVIELTLRASGAAANLMGIGEFASQVLNISGADSTTGHSVLIAPNVAPVVGTSFDATAQQQVDVFATFSIANVGNLIQLQQYRLVSPN